MPVLNAESDTSFGKNSSMSDIWRLEVEAAWLFSETVPLIVTETNVDLVIDSFAGWNVSTRSFGDCKIVDVRTGSAVALSVAAVVLPSTIVERPTGNTSARLRTAAGVP